LSRFVVVLTGGIGSGKTAVSDLLQELGAGIVDTDVIARELTAAGGDAMSAIAARFGKEVLAADGSLDRARMRERAFADPQVKRDLEAILHPIIRARAAERVAALDTPYVVLVVPLLVESGAYRDISDRVLVVDCPESVQIERTLARSRLSRTDAERIVAAQATRAARLAIADDVISNDAGLDALAAATRQLHQRYLALAHAKRSGAGA
jgi:dephospho-CoA kinase